MLHRDDIAYHLRRAAQERAAAAAATDPCVRRIHLYLADGYAERARNPHPPIVSAVIATAMSMAKPEDDRIAD